MTDGRATQPRVWFLDGLRGYAALSVVVCHCTAALFPSVVFGGSKGLDQFLYATPFVNVVFQGTFMVCVFFALSGLALSYHTLARNSRAPAWSGLVRRYPRLMLPVLAGSLLAAGMMSLKLFRVREAARLSHSLWWGKYWFFHPTLASAMYEGRFAVFRYPISFYDPPLWSMHYEILGSLLVFAVLLLSPRRWVRCVAYAVLAWFTRDGYLLAFVGGMAICEAWVALGDRRNRGTALFVPIGIYGLLLGSYPTPSATLPGFYRRVVPPMFGAKPAQQVTGAHVLGAVFVLAAIVAFVPLRRPLETSIARFLGRISFALYILHFLVLGSLGAGLLIALKDFSPYPVNAFLVLAVVVAVSIVVSFAFTRLIDEPTVAITGWVYRKISTPLARLRPARTSRPWSRPATGAFAGSVDRDPSVR